MNIKYYKFLRFSGVAGIFVLWTFTVTGMVRANLGLVDTRPLSYLGVDPSSASLFSSGLIISALLFIAFGVHVRKYFNVRSRFLTFLLIGQAGQLIAAIAPYGEQSQFKLLHTVAAFVLAFSLPVLIRSFAYSQTHTSQFKLYLWLYRFELLTFVIGIGLFIFTSGIAPIGEALPAIGFHVWIIALTFLSRTPQKI